MERGILYRPLLPWAPFTNPSSMSQFAERLKSARIMAGLSLQELAEKIGNRVSRQALHKYEKGAFLPDSEMTGYLCDALNVRPDYFFREEGVVMEEVDFRKVKRFSSRSKNSLTEKIKDRLSRYLELEGILNIEIGFSLSFHNPPIRSMDQVEQFAVNLRAQLNLGLGPVFNLIERLEGHHIKVMEFTLEDGFDGLSAWANSKHVPVIVLNSTRLKSLEQKRFTALYELGHLALNLKGLTDKEKEQYCQYFAGAMLLPKATLEKEVGIKRHKVLIAELGAIKRQYGISIRAIACRMKDLGIITESCFRQFSIQIGRLGFNTTVPSRFDYTGQEESYRFNQLLLHALAEELISMSKAAALANMKLATFREKYLEMV